ncbi:uncharacterized protein LOC128555536 [Mercenaria mercenaria]|uniref:uncharacterized protein LOC128555536 n=1 Tax=Mercenaria mercenaria TaxID=6596 RepID=UPI00234EC940|nr:uncharacterized protein LOC128555536 [Mercenaria mercenaria]
MFNFQVLLCEGCNKASALIRTISENCMVLSKQMHCWLDRTWLTNEMTQEERFLLMLPCLSSFSSQLLLQRVPIKKIFLSSLVDLSKEVPDISVSVLQNLEKLMSSSTGLQLGEVSTDESNGDCYDEDPASEDIVNDVKITVKEVKELSCQQCQGERKVKVTRDIYVPEDFQKVEENVQREIGMGMHAQILTEAMSVSKEADKKNESKDHKKKTKMCKDYLNENLKNRPVPVEENSRRGIKSINVSTDKCGTKENISNKSGPVRTNNFEEWEHLNNFISSKSDFEKDIAKACKDYINDCHESTSSMYNDRYINPVGKLQKMRQRDLLKCSRPENGSSGKHSDAFRKNEHESQYFTKCNTTGYMNSAQNNVNKESVTVSQLPYLTNNTKQMLMEHQGKRHCNTNREMLVFEMSHDHASLSDTQQNANSEDKMYQRHPQQFLNQTEIRKETFDYNHGLPVNSRQLLISDGTVFENPSVADVSVRTHYNNNSNQIHRNTVQNQFGFATGCRVPKSRSDLEKEFPPSEEIDRSISFEKGPNYIADTCNFILERSDKESRTYSVPLPNSKNDNCRSRGSIHVNDDFESVNQRGDNNFPTFTENRREQDGSERLQNDIPVLTFDDSQKIQFDFKPKMVDNFINSVETKPDRIDGNDRHDLYLNPKLERITQRQHVVEEPDEMNDTSNNMSLADDLRETTRKLLANSRQFSRFDAHSKRHPLQKVSIGLAQPRLRNSANVTEEDDRRMMAQSLWGTNDSPPMDLEYDNSQLNRILQNRQDTSNRAIYTNQTPRKKRKLTYQSVPGKGQTKLVFK